MVKVLVGKIDNAILEYLINELKLLELGYLLPYRLNTVSDYTMLISGCITLYISNTYRIPSIREGDIEIIKDITYLLYSQLRKIFTHAYIKQFKLITELKKHFKLIIVIDGCIYLYNIW